VFPLSLSLSVCVVAVWLQHTRLTAAITFKFWHADLSLVSLASDLTSSYLAVITCLNIDYESKPWIKDSKEELWKEMEVALVWLVVVERMEP
jgi:hypothetical protein